VGRDDGLNFTHKNKRKPPRGAVSDSKENPQKSAIIGVNGGFVIVFVMKERIGEVGVWYSEINIKRVGTSTLRGEDVRPASAGDFCRS
jgi:hypothetical protein